MGVARLSRYGKGSLWLALFFALTLAVPVLSVRAEGFIEMPFEQQWKATDEAVTNGLVNRTYFWGPAAFAHTNEVYAEGQNGVRRVQYFDKARMELTKENGQDPNQVTNGLLTVELVTGRLQIGDNTFLQRSPATNPVAGDQTGNSLTPTYASFYNGKLAFGTPGSVPTGNRAGIRIDEAVDAAGNVTTLEQPPALVKYDRYSPETERTIADVFWNFFQQEPLGADKWLSVMGYPISDPFWAKDKVVVGGQKKDVLIQLFQRRVLTYTPYNPDGYQVEMGNIGQHYYVWRYGFNPNDQLPGSFQLVTAQDKGLVSYNIRSGQKTEIKDLVTSKITSLMVTKDGTAFFTAGNTLYQTPLNHFNAVTTAVIPDSLKITNNTLKIESATEPKDGGKVALSLSSTDPSNSDIKRALMVYYVGPIPANTNFTPQFLVADNLNSLYPDSLFSPDGSYLAYQDNNQIVIASVGESPVVKKSYAVAISDTDSSLGFGGWTADNRLLVYANHLDFRQVADTAQGKIMLIHADNGQLDTLLAGPNYRTASLSPDGHMMAVLSINTPTDSFTDNISFRTLAQPDKVVASPLDLQGLARYGNEQSLGDWSADGSYIMANYSQFVNEVAANYQNFTLVSSTGQVIQKNTYQHPGYSSDFLGLIAGRYLLHSTNLVDTTTTPATITESVEVYNLDVSEKFTLIPPQTVEIVFSQSGVVQLPQPQP